MDANSLLNYTNTTCGYGCIVKHVLNAIDYDALIERHMCGQFWTAYEYVTITKSIITKVHKYQQ